MRVIGSMEPEICTKKLANLSENPQSKVSCDSTTLLHSENALSEFVKLEASPVEGQLLKQNDKKR